MLLVSTDHATRTSSTTTAVTPCLSLLGVREGRGTKDRPIVMGLDAISLPCLGLASLDEELSLEPPGGQHPLHDFIVEAVQDPRNHGHGGRPKRLARVDRTYGRMTRVVPGTHHGTKGLRLLFMREQTSRRRVYHVDLDKCFGFWPSDQTGSKQRLHCWCFRVSHCFRARGTRPPPGGGTVVAWHTHTHTHTPREPQWTDSVVAASSAVLFSPNGTWLSRREESSRLDTLSRKQKSPLSAVVAAETRR